MPHLLLHADGPRTFPRLFIHPSSRHQIFTGRLHGNNTRVFYLRMSHNCQGDSTGSSGVIINVNVMTRVAANQTASTGQRNSNGCA